VELDVLNLGAEFPPLRSPRLEQLGNRASPTPTRPPNVLLGPMAFLAILAACYRSWVGIGSHLLGINQPIYFIENISLLRIYIYEPSYVVDEDFSETNS